MATDTFTNMNRFFNRTDFYGPVYMSSLSFPNSAGVMGIVNVMDFGALGNGTNDDTISIQAAIDAASTANSTVYFPPGTYIIGSHLIAKSNCTFLGADKYLSTLSLPQSNISSMDYSMIECTGSISNFSMRNLGLRGNRSFQTTAFTNGAFDGYAVGFFTGTMTNIFFEDLYVREFGATGAAKNTGGGGILIVPTGTDVTCKNIQCRNVHFGNNDHVSGFYLDCSEGSVSGGGNTILVTGCTFNGGGNNNACYVLGGYGATSAQRMNNVTITDNLFYLTEDVDTCVEVNGVYNFSINCNRFYFTSTGDGNTILVRSGCVNGAINNNTIVSFNSDASTPAIGIIAFNSGEFQDNINIMGNTFYIDNSALNDFIKILKGSRKINIIGNVFYGNSTAVNRVIDIGEATDVEISENQFNNAVTCIRLSAGTTPSTARIGIRSNRFFDCGGSGSAQIVTTGGTISVTEIEVEDNVVMSPKSTAGGAAFAILAASANTGNILKGNKVYGGLALTDSTAEWAHIEDNIGYNPVGPSTITVGASVFTYTAGVTHETVYIYGGTVSDISVAGTTVATASPAQVQLPSGVSVAVTYTVAPTMKKYIH